MCASLLHGNFPFIFTPVNNLSDKNESGYNKSNAEDVKCAQDVLHGQCIMNLLSLQFFSLEMIEKLISC